MLSTLEAGIEQLLLGAAAHLLETGRFADSRRPVGQFTERGAAPQAERASERRRCPVRLAGGRQHPATTDEFLEAVHIELVRFEGQPVAGRGRLDRGRAERLADESDGCLDLLRPRRRWTLTPDRVRELVRPHHMTPLQRQRAQDRSLTGAERSVGVDDHRSEKCHAHDCHCPGRSTPGQRHPYQTNTGARPDPIPLGRTIAPCEPQPRTCS